MLFVLPAILTLTSVSVLGRSRYADPFDEYRRTGDSSAVTTFDVVVPSGSMSATAKSSSSILVDTICFSGSLYAHYGCNTAGNPRAAAPSTDGIPYHHQTRIRVSPPEAANDTCTQGHMGDMPTVAAYRSIKYQVLDQNGDSWRPEWGPLSVTEIVVSTGGTVVNPGIPGGTWTVPTTINSAGDYAKGNFTTQPLTIGFYGSDYLVLANYYAANTVLVAGVAAPGGCK
jgi:hypothetical protein